MKKTERQKQRKRDGKCERERERREEGEEERETERERKREMDKVNMKERKSSRSDAQRKIKRGNLTEGGWLSRKEEDRRSERGWSTLRVIKSRPSWSPL